MTQPQDDDVRLSESAPEEDQAQTPTGPDEGASDGQHGRPSDDSDPGHS